MTKLECLAVIFIIEKFQEFLKGRLFAIYTDHDCLQWLDINKQWNNRVPRWAVKLQDYKYEVIYGKNNQIADV